MIDLNFYGQTQLVLPCYLQVTLGYLVVTSDYLIATTGYFLLLLVPRFSKNVDTILT